MDSLEITKLCETLNLGKLMAYPEEVAGGLIHRMWRITTSKGMFAVKQLNPERLCTGNAWQRHQTTEQIAMIFANHGVPAGTALRNGQEYVQRIGEVSLIVYPWVEGSRLESDYASLEQCLQIGFALGQMHLFQLDLPGIEFTFAFPYPSFPKEHWAQLVQRGRKKAMPWTDTIDQFVPQLIKFNTEYTLACEELQQIMVVSHRDLDQKNILWTNPASFKIIDWEASGLINPTMDLLAVALNWSGLRDGQCRPESFDAIIRGYQDAGATKKTSSRIAFFGCIGKWFNWLEYNLQRSLDLKIDSNKELQLALTEIDTTLTTLCLLEKHKHEWTDWLETIKTG